MRFDRSAKVAFVIACLTLVGSGLAFQSMVKHLNIYLRKEPVELRVHFSSIARSLDTWHAVGNDLVHDAAMIEELGTNLYLDRTYARLRNSRSLDANMNIHSDEVEDWLALHIAYYTGMIDAVPHVPDRCMVAGGFTATSQPEFYDLDVDKSNWRYDESVVNHRTGKPYPYVLHADPVRAGRISVVRMPIGEYRLRVTRFRHPDYADRSVYAGFFFIGNGRATASTTAVRALAFDRTDRFSYYCKIQFTKIGSQDMTADDFVASVSSLLSELLPEIMRCLPDWSEVEQSGNEPVEQVARR
jgi:hypothetical protein